MSSSKLRVIVADDHDIYLEGLEAYLSTDPGIDVVATAADGERLVSLVHSYQPDVVLTDLRMPKLNGIEAIRRIAAEKSRVLPVILSTFDDDYLVFDALCSGAKGYVSKEVNKQDVLAAIKYVGKGFTYFCRSTSDNFIDVVLRSELNPFPKKPDVEFSEQEKSIIKLICEQKTSEEIGKQLYIGTKTVEKYRTRIMEKIKVKNVAGLVIYALKNGLYHFPEGDEWTGFRSDR